MVYIYVLKLEEDKYYVGKTDNPDFRIKNHFYSNGSAWTKKYKPVELVELIPDCDDYDEDKYTIKYMDTYGIDNVRGGSFVSVILDDNTKSHLKQMSNSTNGCCFRCGKKGHFAKNCYTYINNKRLEESDYEEAYCCEYCNKVFSDDFDCLRHEQNCRHKYKNEASENGCFRCGRTDHYAYSCYAKTYSDGTIIHSSSDDTSDDEY